MKKVLALAAAGLPLLLAGCSHPAYYYAAPPPPPAYSAVAQQGYNQGVRAAQRDIGRGWGADVNRHPDFRNPPVAPPLMNDYRHAFREGYRAVYQGGQGRY